MCSFSSFSLELVHIPPQFFLVVCFLSICSLQSVNYVSTIQDGERVLELCVGEKAESRLAFHRRFEPIEDC